MWPGYAGATVNLQIVLNAQKVLTKFSYPKKSFDHPHHLKSGVAPLEVPACKDDSLHRKLLSINFVFVTTLKNFSLHRWESILQNWV